MVYSSAKSVSDYLKELEPARRSEVEPVIGVVRENIQFGHNEAMAYGMIAWQVPLEVSGPTYHQQPSAPVALAVQKHHISLYLRESMQPKS